jgi:hypothetical protein
MYIIDIQHSCSVTLVSISVANTIEMMRKNTTMKMEKILIFPLNALLTLIVLVASRKSCWLPYQSMTNTTIVIETISSY